MIDFGCELCWYEWGLGIQVMLQRNAFPFSLSIFLGPLSLWIEYVGKMP